MKLKATADIPAEALGEPPIPHRGDVFDANEDQASRLIEAGLAVFADSPEAQLLRHARASLAGKYD